MSDNQQSIAGVAAKISRVSSIVGHVGKNGENTHFKFKYQAWDDVLPAVRGACVEVGLVILPNIVSTERGDKYVTIKARFDCIDTETGQTLAVEYAGEANGNDDKAIQKAMTSATKYAFLKLFQISTKDDHDPDGDPAPKQSEAPNRATEAAPVIDWNARGVQAFGGDKKAFEAWTAKGASVMVAWGALLKKVWATSGDKTTSVELEAALSEAIAKKASEAPKNGKALKETAEEVFA